MQTYPVSPTKRGSSPYVKTANEFNCTLFQKHVSEYIDDEIDGSLRTAFLEHAAACRSCGRLFADLRAIHESLSGLQRIEVPDDFNMSLRARITNEVQRLESPMYRARLWIAEHRPSLVSIPAAAAVLIAALLFGTSPINHQEDFRDIAGTNTLESVELTASGEDTDLEMTRYILESVDARELESGIFLEESVTVSGGNPFQLTSTSF